MPKFLFPVLLLVLTFTACNTPSHKASAEAPQSLADVPTDTTPAFTTTVLQTDLASPRKEMKGTIDGVNLTINYGSPAVKGRSLWGTLIPFGKVWRTGANEATRVTIDQAITIGGQTLPAGTYSLFSVPGASEWELIFNSTADQWGAYEYDETKDVLRIKAQPQLVENSIENLEFTIARGSLVLSWEKLRLPVAISKA
ncbi:MAG: hypothetical protein DA408_19065 [Bacteroidetes bacterium]|nr:MAG: hypothetical protein C7N36_11920 [Bacteroidota bacterium]PTM09120.1 MAG: hypothetical protein DA408_19065 [Bacteroidota bacterium]